MYEELVSMLRKCAAEAAACKTCELDSNPSCSDYLMKQAADAIEELSMVCDNLNFLNKHPWIPVTEQIPDEYTTILFITGGGEPRVGYYDSDHKSYCDTTGFRYMCTHWMPLPQPPGVPDINVGNKTCVDCQRDCQMIGLNMPACTAYEPPKEE